MVRRRSWLRGLESERWGGSDRMDMTLGALRTSERQKCRPSVVVRCVRARAHRPPLEHMILTVTVRISKSIHTSIDQTAAVARGIR